MEGAARADAYALGPFILDAEARIVLRDRVPLPLGERAVSVLLLLVTRAGELVTKDDLLNHAWSGLIVEESNLTVQIATLRRVLDAAPDGAAWIETLPRRGYRFIGPVSRLAPLANDSGAETRWRFSPEGVPSLAVLPFRALDPSAVPSYFANGLVEEIVCMLAGLHEVTVLSSGSTHKFRNREVDSREVSQDLGVRYVVSGAVRRSSSRLRVIAELTDAETSAVRWSHAYDAEESLLFDAQDNIVAQIVQTLAPQVRDAELRRVRARRPTDMAAYQLVLQARELIYRLERPAFERAEELLRQAMNHDPGYAAAYVLAAEWHSLRVGQGWSPDPIADARAADRFATAAISLDGSNARALAFHGHNKSFLFRDYEGALSYFEKALAAGPNDAAAWGWSAPTQIYLGNGEAAIRCAERALSLSPFDPFAFQFESFVSGGHYTKGSYEAAVKSGMRSMDQQPNYTANLRVTAAALAALNRLDEATAIGRRIMAIEPSFRVGNYVVNHPYREEVRRVRLGEELILAGLPP